MTDPHVKATTTDAGTPVESDEHSLTRAKPHHARA